MFSRYSERSQRVIVLAQDEARRLGHPYVGVEHILLGLLLEGEGLASKVLQSLGLSPEQLRETVERVVGRGDAVVQGAIGFTPPAKKVMVESAIEEARLLGHNYVGTEHLLLGLLRDSDGVAARVLQQADVGLPALRDQVVHMLGSRPPEPPNRLTPPGTPRWVPLLPLADEVSHVILPLANAEARRVVAPAIGPEHLLLGMLRDAGPSRVTAVLKKKGVTLEWLRKRLAEG